VAALNLQVCDQPHPLLVAQIVRHCLKAQLSQAYAGMKVLLYLPDVLNHTPISCFANLL
jgi:hypothetical protein